MVGKINMKQLRRQEERAKKKQAMREMEEEQCTEYFEESTKGAVNAKEIDGKGQGNEEKKQERKEEKEGLGTISWHGEEETDSITFPEDLKTAYETLKIKASTSDEVVVEYLLDKVEHLSFDRSPDTAKETSLELGCIILVLCDRTSLYNSELFILLQFIYAVEATKFLGRLRLPCPKIANFTAPSIIPNFPVIPDDLRHIATRLSAILLNRQFAASEDETVQFVVWPGDCEHEQEEETMEGDEDGENENVPNNVKLYVSKLLREKEQLQSENFELKEENTELKADKKKLKSEKDRLGKTNMVLSALADRRKEEEQTLPKVGNSDSQLEELRKESSQKDAEIKSLREREEKTNSESKMRERASKQLAEKHEIIRELRESNAKLAEDSTITSAQITTDDKLKTELADVKVQLREAQAKSTSFSEFKECISLQSKASKELAVEVARLKGSSSLSTSTPSSTDKKDFVISTLSKKVIDLSKQVKEQNEQLAEMMTVMSKSDDD